MGTRVKFQLDKTKLESVSVRVMQLSIHVDGTNPEVNFYQLMMKGAPERIIDLCSTIAINGEDVPLTDEWRTAFEQVL